MSPNKKMKKIIISILLIVILLAVMVYSNAEVSRESIDEKTYTIEEATKYNNWTFDDVYGIKVYQNYSGVYDVSRKAPCYFEISTDIMEVTEHSDSTRLVRIVEEIKMRGGATHQVVRYELYLADSFELTPP